MDIQPEDLHTPLTGGKVALQSQRQGGTSSKQLPTVYGSLASNGSPW